MNAVERGFVYLSIVFYHDAFIATGGTETEWKTHDLQTTIDYQIFNQSEQYLSFVVTSTDSWNTASAEDKSITTQIFPQKTACPVIFRLPSKRFLIPKRS